MKPKTAVITVALLTLAAVPLVASNCDRPPAALMKPTPATAPSATGPADAVARAEPPLTPVTAEPSRPMSSILIDGTSVPFPAARLVVGRRRGGGVSAVLCSDDPPAAIEPTYAGNSFMFPMKLDVSRASELPLATWEFRPDAADDATGIFLHGARETLRPSQVTVTFRKDGDDVLIYLNGSFLRFDPHDPIATPETVNASACLRTTMSDR